MVLLAGSTACSVPSSDPPTGDARFGMATDARGAAYILQCQNAGVPVPEFVADPDDPAWVVHGEVVDPFVDKTTGLPDEYLLEAELWSWVPSSGEGICLALPRWLREGPHIDRAETFGLICLGSVSSKACFFDNPAGQRFERGKRHAIGAFLGGADLAGNNQGECSDCHAGENPFIVHPSKAAFASLYGSGDRLVLLSPTSGWYEPLVPFGWPLNPGPERRLDGIDSRSSCLGCHALPALSTDLPGFCDLIEVATSRADETMPPEPRPPGVTLDDYREGFQPHIQAALDVFCGRPPPRQGGTVVSAVSHVDNLSILSPPTVAAPLHTCAERVRVTGVVEGAAVQLWIDGNLEATHLAGSTGEVSFAWPTGLQDQQGVKARMVLNGAPTPYSTEVVVHDYPLPSLPQPVIEPRVYACARSISVRNLVPGSKLTAWQNGLDPQVSFTESGAQIMSPGPTPWDAGDVFTVQATLCSLTSSVSEPAEALVQPSTLHAPRFDPAQTYEGQTHLVLRDMTYGAYGEVSRVAPSALDLGDTCDATTGVSCPFGLESSALGRALLAGESLKAVPAMYCPMGPTGPPTSTPPALPCGDLPAPVIAQPYKGDDHLVVLEALPGARIRVYDASMSEIADGAGTIIRLVPPRLVQWGETLTVVQQVGACFGTNGYRVVVPIGAGGGA